MRSSTNSLLLLAAAALTFTTTVVYARYDPVRMLCKVNQIREESGLPALGMNSALTRAAQEHSRDQANMREMAHDGSDGSQPSDRIEDAGYDWQKVAENVAYGYDDQDECLNQWMESPGHRENILMDGLTHMGTAVEYSSDGTPYYTQDFGGDGSDHDYPVCPSGGDYGNDDYGNDDYGNDDYASSRGRDNSGDDYGQADYGSARDSDDQDYSDDSYGNDDYGNDDYGSARGDYGSRGRARSSRGDYDDYGRSRSSSPAYAPRGYRPGHDNRRRDANDYGSARSPRRRSRSKSCDDNGRDSYGSSRAYLARRSAEPNTQHGMSHWAMIAPVSARFIKLIRRAPAPDHHDNGSQGDSSWSKN